MAPPRLRGLLNKAPPKKALAKKADEVEAAGRKGDGMLMHVTSKEVATLDAAARANGEPGLTINPKTEKPEAWAAEQDSVAAEIDVAAGGNRDVDTNAGMGTGAPSGATTDETSLLDKTMDLAKGVLGLDKKGDFTAKGTAGALLGGLGPPGLGTAMGLVAGVASDRNIAQIESARANGSLSEADYAAIQAGGSGTIKGGGLAGEDVQVGLHGSNSNPDRGGTAPNAGAEPTAAGPAGGASSTPDYSANYRTSGRGLLTGPQQQPPPAAPAPYSPGPRDRQAPDAYASGDWVVNRTSGRVEWVQRRGA